MNTVSVKSLRICSDLDSDGLHRSAEIGSGIRFTVSEYAVLADGREIRLVANRGWTVFPGDVSVEGYLATVTRIEFEEDSRNLLLADDAEETGERQDWQAHVARLGEQGIATSIAELRRLPSIVEVSERVLSRLHSGAP